MNTRNYIILGLILTIALFLVSCGQKNKADEESKTDSIKKWPVKIAILEMKVAKKTLDYTANIVAFEELYLAPATPGRIKKINVEIGDRISTGQIVAEMDASQLNQAKVQLLGLEKDFARMDTLILVGGISQQKYDQVKTQLDVARSSVNFLEENTYLRSPFNGIVTGKYFENGELYSGAPNTQVGKPAIVTLQQINPIKAIINVSEKYYPVVTKEMLSDIQLDIYPDEVFHGKVYSISPTVNSMTRTFQVEIVANNPGNKLRPGMFARVELEIGEDEAIIVPVSAILQQTGTNNRYLFKYNNGIAQKILIIPGRRFDDEMEIISEDLKVGDKIIVAGHDNLIDNNEVEIVD